MKFIVRNLSLPLEAKETELAERIAKEVRYSPACFSYKILKKSIDARKNQVSFIYSVVVESSHYLNGRNVLPYKEVPPLVIKPYASNDRPVIVGFGPSGMYAGLILARSGAKPIILERGKAVTERKKDIEALRQKSLFNPESNVCYGEGGAGTFSDGKLNTGVNDEHTKFILEEFVKHGANPEILYDAMPHIGSDYLQNIVKSFREEIISLGGDILFESCFNRLVLEKGRISGLIYTDKDHSEHEIMTSHVLLAIGHSPYDTISSLLSQGLVVEPKDFSIGVRIEHLQSEINKASYHQAAGNSALPSASYKGVYHLANGRSIYTFCNCPGGYVFNSSTEAETVLTNGMSNHDRANVNGNSALLVNVKVSDFFKGHPLDGFNYRSSLERVAFCKEKPYFAPYERVGDFLKNQEPSSYKSVVPSYQPGVFPKRLDKDLPPFISEALKEGLHYFASRMDFFKDEDAIMTGYETRSSSPVRIPRSETFESNLLGLYPLGEGASYAGGITSAALDGLKVALSLLKS